MRLNSTSVGEIKVSYKKVFGECKFIQLKIGCQRSGVWSGVECNAICHSVSTGLPTVSRLGIGFGFGHRRRVEWMKNEFNCPMLGVNIFEMGSRICCRQRTSDSATDNMENNNRSNNKFAELSNILATFLWQATAVKLWPLQGVGWGGGVCRGVPVWPTSGSKSCIRMSKTLARESKHNTHNISVHFGVVGGHQSKFRSLCSPLPSSSSTSVGCQSTNLFSLDSGSVALWLCYWQQRQRQRQPQRAT